MKKNLLRIVSLSIASMIGIHQASAYTFESAGVYYDINKDGTTVSVTFKDKSYASYSGDVVIPEAVTNDGVTYKVTELGKYSLRNSAKMTSVSMPKTLKVIGMGAFSKCDGLKTVVIPDSVTEVGNYAIQDCPNLETIIIGKSVKSIGSGAFMGNVAMKSITIPESVTSVSISAFQNCTALTEVFIPATLTTLNSRAFTGCIQLININVAEGNPNYTSIDGVLFNKTKTQLLAYPGGRTDAEYTVPEGVEELTVACFAQRMITVSGHEFFNTELKKINLPASMKILGNSAFQALAAMESIVIPSGITKIGNATFDTCISLKSVEIPDATTSLDQYSFQDCSSLTSVVIGTGMASIAKNSFTGCSSLQTVTCKATTPPACTKTPVFEATVTASAKLIVPKNAVDTYKAAAVWADFTNIIGENFSGISNIESSTGAVAVEYYTIQGVKTSEPTRGVNIVKMSDGSIHKILVR